MSNIAPSVPLLQSLSAALRRPLSRSGLTTPLTCQCGARRGKKKNAKARNDIWIKLRADVPAYGRKGTIVPVPIGQMRNHFYPRNLADYVAQQQQRDMRRSNTVVERDATFGREIEAAAKAEEGTPEAKVARMSEPRTVDLKLLPAQKAFDLLSATVPAVMDFYRTPIASRGERVVASSSSSSSSYSSASSSATSAADTIAPPPDTTPRLTPSNIYGSVSTADIAVNIRALLQKGGMAGLIVLPDEDVVFVDLGADGGSEGGGKEASRVKKLGEFAYEVRIRGLGEMEHGGVVRRVARVVSDDESGREEVGRVVEEEGSGVFGGLADGEVMEGRV